jgi:hypothetical protein
LGPGCACSLLSDDANWGEAFFALDRDQVGAMAQTFRLIREASNGTSFSVLAEWMDNEPAPTPGGPIRISFERLLGELKQARIVNKRTLIVETR